jgi:hypothetical protein
MIDSDYAQDELNSRSDINNPIDYDLAHNDNREEKKDESIVWVKNLY